MADALTPTPVIKPRTMDFPDAIREIISGKKVARVSWANDDYGCMKDGWLTIYRNNKFNTWLVNDGDTDGQDWVIVGEVN